jgi:hypothetical protein
MSTAWRTTWCGPRGNAPAAAKKADIGKVHDLARSFALRADPTVIAELGRQPGVRAILPSRIADAFPKPVRHRPG